MFNFGMARIARNVYQRNLWSLYFHDGSHCQVMKTFGIWRPLFVPAPVKARMEAAQNEINRIKNDVIENIRRTQSP